jgi:homoserine dehydrogenase
MIVSSVLQDVNIVNVNDAANIVDRSNIRRKRAKIRKATKQTEEFDLKGLYFDGRKDKTMIYNDGRREIISEEHIVLISEPGGQFLTHVSPKSGTSQGIVQEIKSFLKNNQHVVTTNLSAIGCDGTVVNTGNIRFVFLIFFFLILKNS